MLRALAVAAMLGAAATAWAADDAADADTQADAAVSKCVTTCEGEHERCEATAKAKRDDCERQKTTCEQGCAMCTKMYGPQVVYCVNDCGACRARIAASPCAKDTGGDTDCAQALDACLERCGP